MCSRQFTTSLQAMPVLSQFVPSSGVAVMKLTQPESKTKAKKQRRTKWQKIKDIEITSSTSLSLQGQLLSLLSSISPLKRTCFFIGLNSVMKSIERKQAMIVCLCKDSPKNMLDGLVDACLVQHIPIVCLPSTTVKELANSLSLKRACCFSLPISSVIQDKNLVEHEIGLIDGIREILLNLVGPRAHVEQSNSEEK
jgi:ribosomal protein L7Ae-like RNA K-turn-binding protein